MSRSSAGQQNNKLTYLHTMDKNDMIRSRNEAANKVAAAAKEKADVLQLAVTEQRSNSADEETKLEKIGKDLDSLRSVLRAEDAKIA